MQSKTKEYWIIYVEQQYVEVHTLSEDGVIRKSTFRIAEDNFIISSAFKK